jgi:hypothetical protein
MTGLPDDAEARLLAIFRALDADDRHALQAYAEFLAVRGGMRSTAAEATVTAEPAPEGETVVMAIKRLTRTYPMIERRKLIGRTSELMAEHALQGRPAVEVIAELEMVFEEHFRKTVQRET